MRNETLGERIFRELKRDILSGFYSPGERLLYEKVAERLGVSMTPLKDAFMKLEQEGLVTTYARRGTFVTELTEEDVIEYSQIRLALESLAVELACSRTIHEEEFNKLQEINNQIKKAVKNQNPNDCIKNDMKFHLKVVSLSGNNRLSEMLYQFPLSNFLVLMGMGKRSIEIGEIVVKNHNKIIEALKIQDSSTIKELLKHNILDPYYQIFHERHEEAHTKNKQNTG